MTYGTAGRRLVIKGTPLAHGPSVSASVSPARIEMPGVGSRSLSSIYFYVQADRSYPSAEILDVLRSLTPAPDLGDPGTW